MPSQPTTPRDGQDPVSRRVPIPLLAATAVTVLEAAVLLGYAVLEAVHFDRDRATMGVTTTVFFVAYAAALLLCAWGLSRLAWWARGPVVLTQLIVLGLAWSFRDTVWVALVLVVAAAVVIAGLLHPASTAALEDEDHS